MSLGCSVTFSSNLKISFIRGSFRIKECAFPSLDSILFIKVFRENGP